MPEEPSGRQDIIIWDEGGVIYKVPQSLFAQYQLSDAERAEVEGALLDQGEGGAEDHAGLTSADFINPIPQDVLAPYQISAEDLVAMATADDVQGHGQFIGVFPQTSTGYGPTGIGGKWAVRTMPSYQLVAMNQRQGGNPCPTLH